MGRSGDHGVPGGENIVVTPDGAVRYFTIRECGRLQTFPDDYAFVGTWKSLVRQIGNAVPVALVERVAAEIHKHLVVCDGKFVQAVPGNRFGESVFDGTQALVVLH